MRGIHLQFDSTVCSFGTTRAVDEVCLDIFPGEHVALIGTNGSGKTTLLRAVLGLHALTSGRILLDGLEAKSSTDWARRRTQIAWMPQRHATGHFPLLVHELLGSSTNREAALNHAHELGVGNMLKRPLFALSGGQLQRVFLARALGSIDGGAGILLADEPTSALDFDGQTKLAEVLRTLTVTVLVVTHDRAMANRCERVVEMASGRLREIVA